MITVVVEIGQIWERFGEYPQDLLVGVRVCLVDVHVGDDCLEGDAWYQLQYSPLLVEGFSYKLTEYYSVRFVPLLWIVIAVLFVGFFLFLLFSKVVRRFLLCFKRRNSSNYANNQDFGVRKASDISTPEDNQSCSVISLTETS